MSERELRNMIMQHEMALRDLRVRIANLEQALQQLGRVVEQRAVVFTQQDQPPAPGTAGRWGLVTLEDVLHAGTPIEVPFSYIEGKYDLMVIVNGRLLMCDEDYKEEDPKHISFYYDLPAGLKIIFIGRLT